MTYEQQFLDALKSIFIGAKVEGDSGYINLMKIKANYFEKGVFPVLMKDIDSACKPFEKGFREELFDKLHDFFRHYFSESGSIYFRNTAQHHNIYEKVYTDDRDVMLFWKTHMLYYVKTDRLFNSMEVDVDGEKFFFDVSGMELKRSNEKRGLIYDFKNYKDGKVNLVVTYAEGNRKTKVAEIAKSVKAKGVNVEEETLEKAFAVFQKQSEVDYFINKDAKAFLQEQFDLWLYQYIFKGESEFNETRLKQLQAMKGIATKIIDFIAQFEDELVKIWNKPKFVLNSNYIITLDHVIASGAKQSPVKQSTRKNKEIASSPASQAPRNDIVERIFKHKGMKDQIAEWQKLGMVDKKFKLDMVLEKDLVGEPVHPQYQYLPLDTKYFKDLELDILALFDDLDSSLDGWLIHSENYQALNTLLPKFRERVKAIYIDPPYNAAATEIAYENRFKHSSWLTLLKDRLLLSREYLRANGVICVTIDDYEISRLQLALDEVYSEENYLATASIRNNPSGRSTVKGFAINHEYGLFYANASEKVKVGRFAHSEEQKNRYDEIDEAGRHFEWENLRKSSSGSQRKDRPKQYFPIYYNENVNTLRVPKMQWVDSIKKYNILEKPSQKDIEIFPLDDAKAERVWSYGVKRVKEELNEFKIEKQGGKLEIYKKKYLNERGILARTWWESPAYSARDNGTRVLAGLFGSSKGFEFPKALKAVEDCLIVSSVTDDSLVLDFFAGSGTTAHTLMNLNRDDDGKRKYILVEMGEHFSTVILPRVKKVAFSDKWKDGKAQEGQGMSHFVKYFELEQYEDALKKARYEDAPLFQGTQDAYTSYAFLRDLKMLEAVEVNKEQNQVQVSLNRLYEGIDLAETLSCLTGKWIKRITKDTVEFQDGTTASLSAPEWDDVRPLIWW